MIRLRRAAVGVSASVALATGGFAAPSVAHHGYDVDCGDFTYQQDAQAHLNAHPTDPDRLDSDDDGVACESLPSRPSNPTPEPPPVPEPPRAVPQARETDDSCPSEVVTEDGFDDVTSANPFEAVVDCVAHWDVTRGTSTTTYSPLVPVTREQMAAFIARVIEKSGGSLPRSPRDAFTDDERSNFETQINQLAGTGVVNGTGSGRYAPRAFVTRAQMAAFLVRAYEHRTGVAVVPGGDYFPDDDGLSLEKAINAAATAGFAGGYADGTYGPRQAVRRDHMAAFLARLLDLLVEEGHGTVPGAAVVPAPGTAVALLAALDVEPELGPGYDRDLLFGGWGDADRDGCDTRSEVLQQETLAPVSFSSSCTVATGQWLSYYDAATWTQASDVDIDHVVPLAEAWRSGVYADAWPASQRVAFAHDLAFEWSLEAVTDNVNQSKGDQDPAEWLPPDTSAHCEYGVRWVAVKHRWDLSVDVAERAVLADLLSGGCGAQEMPVPPRP